ncbi:MAG: hypothetical protein LBD94_01155 [Rickettsiales bacterium]|jgi:hypothetical protein|nr:hypothetical protein [Rickettsiales bacterium]
MSTKNTKNNMPFSIAKFMPSAKNKMLATSLAAMLLAGCVGAGKVAESDNNPGTFNIAYDLKTGVYMDTRYSPMREVNGRLVSVKKLSYGRLAYAIDTDGENVADSATIWHEERPGYKPGDYGSFKWSLYTIKWADIETSKDIKYEDYPKLAYEAKSSEFPKKTIKRGDLDDYLRNRSRQR